MYDPPGATDGDGKFRISKKGTGINDQDYKIIVLHDTGFVKIFKADFEKQKEPLRLIPWARIEGTLKIGDKPGKRMLVGLSYNPADEDFTKGKPYISFSYLRNMTDENGKFVFDRVFPGEGSVAQIFEQKDLGGNVFSWRYAKMAPYRIKEGETQTIDVGGGGRSVIGKVVIPADSPNASKLRTVYVEAKLQTLKVPDFGEDRNKALAFYSVPMKRASDRRPGWAPRASDMEEEVRAWEKSPEGQAAIVKNPERYKESREVIDKLLAFEKSREAAEKSARFVMIDADGNFRLEDVPPGNWTIAASLEQHSNDGSVVRYIPPIRAGKPLTVPVGALDRPIDAEVIELKERSMDMVPSEN